MCYCYFTFAFKAIRLQKLRYQSECARHASGITFNIYAQNRKIGKPNNLVLRAIKPKGQHRLMSPMSEGGELRSPMSEGREP